MPNEAQEFYNEILTWKILSHKENEASLVFDFVSLGV